MSAGKPFAWPSGLRPAAVTVLTAVTIACGATEGTSQSQGPAIDRDSLLADIDLMVGALEVAHPRLNHYVSADRTEAAFAAGRAAIDRDMSALEFYRIAAEAVAAIQDGHTQVRFPSADGALVPPIAVHVQGRRVWVVTGLAEGAPDAGAEILSIDGRPIGEVLELMGSRISRDYGLGSGKRALIGNRFAELYADLVDARPSNNLVVRSNGVADTIQVAAAPRDEVRQAQREALGTPPPIAWRMLDPATAYVDLNSFNAGTFEAVDRQFRASLDSALSFVRANAAGAMILDIRGNGGGEASNGAYAASHLLDLPFQYLYGVRARSNALPAIEYTQWAEDADANQAEYGSILAERDDGYFDVTGPWYPTELVQPKDSTFTGRLYVLIDGFVSSTGSDFAAILHAHDRAVFLGEMMGGAYDGNASGLTAQIRLPHSGATLNLPLFDFSMASGAAPHPSGAFEPNVTVPMTIEDVLAGRDPVLEAALRRAASDTG